MGRRHTRTAIRAIPLEGNILEPQHRYNLISVHRCAKIKSTCLFGIRVFFGKSRHSRRMAGKSMYPLAIEFTPERPDAVLGCHGPESESPIMLGSAPDSLLHPLPFPPVNGVG